MQSSWLEQVGGVFDAIVSNPPYIREADEHMPALRHEPRHALTSGEDGLQDIRTIIAQAPAHLKAGGWLLLEHGWDQAADVQSLLRTAGFTQVHSRQDLAGMDRCTGGQIPESAAGSQYSEIIDRIAGLRKPWLPCKEIPMSDVQQRIDQLVKNNDILLFMKGSASFPMCGFSGRGHSNFEGLRRRAQGYCHRERTWKTRKFAKASRTTATGPPFPSCTSRANSSAARTS